MLKAILCMVLGCTNSAFCEDTLKELLDASAYLKGNAKEVSLDIVKLRDNGGLGFLERSLRHVLGASSVETARVIEDIDGLVLYQAIALGCGYVRVSAEQLIRIGITEVGQPELMGYSPFEVLPVKQIDGITAISIMGRRL